jgi:uncharacterized FAD-dependent dehydrogenase
MTKNFDIIIVGAGLSGIMAAYHINKKSPDASVLLLDMGRPPLKRRTQTMGWLGLLPSSDGKFYINNNEVIENFSTKANIKRSQKQIISLLNGFGVNKKVLEFEPSQDVVDNFAKCGFKYKNPSYIQTIPKEIHQFSKQLSKEMEQTNITTSFDEEIVDVEKEGDNFKIYSNYFEYECKKLIVAVGRSGWRCTRNLLKSFDLLQNNDVAKYGVRVECDSNLVEKYNKAPVILNKDNVVYGPFNWNGTVIPEDHVDFITTSFRSNEERWNSSKVSFEMMGHIKHKDGSELMERLGKLSCVISNDRIIKEKLSSIKSNKHKLSILKEFDWLGKALEELEVLIPGITNCGSFYIPTVETVLSPTKMNNKFETELNNLHLIGESAGIRGLMQVSITGHLLAENMF